MTLLDHHAHWLQEVVLEQLSRRNESPRARREQGRWGFQAAIKPPLLDRASHYVDHRAGQLAALGIYQQVLAWCLRDFAQAEAMAPWFDAAQALHWRLSAHPGPLSDTRCSDDGLGRCHMHRHLGLEPQHEIGLAMLTFCQEGWLATVPGVAVQFANGNGSFRAAVQRFQRMAEDDTQASPRRTGPLAQVIVDTVSLRPVGVRALQTLFGRGRVVLGTDTPNFDLTRAIDDWRPAHL